MNKNTIFSGIYLKSIMNCFTLKHTEHIVCEQTKITDLRSSPSNLHWQRTHKPELDIAYTALNWKKLC